MRAWLRLIACLVCLLAPAPLYAAPTCQDQNVGTIRCGTPGAMPVGWTVLDHPAAAAQPANTDLDDPAAVLKAVCIVGMLLALIALMPGSTAAKTRIGTGRKVIANGNRERLSSRL